MARQGGFYAGQGCGALGVEASTSAGWRGSDAGQVARPGGFYAGQVVSALQKAGHGRATRSRGNWKMADDEPETVQSLLRNEIAMDRRTALALPKLGKNGV